LIDVAGAKGRARGPRREEVEVDRAARAARRQGEGRRVSQGVADRAGRLTDGGRQVGRVAGVRIDEGAGDVLTLLQIDRYTSGRRGLSPTVRARDAAGRRAEAERPVGDRTLIEGVVDEVRDARVALRG